MVVDEAFRHIYKQVGLVRNALYETSYSLRLFKSCRLCAIPPFDGEGVTFAPISSSLGAVWLAIISFLDLTSRCSSKTCDTT